MSTEYGLVMPFLNDSQDFTLGYECGTIAMRMERGDKFDRYLLHTQNKAQVEIMGTRFHYQIEFTRLNEDWITMTGSRYNAN